MTEARSQDIPRILSEQQRAQLANDIFAEIANETWKDRAYANLLGVKNLIRNGITTIQTFEEATHGTHPEVHTDTDIVYIDSGPGPYSYTMLEEGQADVEDMQYHKWPWSRRMDRERIKAGYALTAMVTAKRIEEQTGTAKKPAELTTEDFDKYGPYFMYASAPWQNKHIQRVLDIERAAGNFRIPDSKIIMYETYTTREGEEKAIVDTADQIEGLHYPPFEGKEPPRRIAMVSHPAHLMRIMHMIGKYPESIPQGTTLQAFPVPTPKSAGTEYTQQEILGTLAYVLKKGRATLEPYDNYEI